MSDPSKDAIHHEVPPAQEDLRARLEEAEQMLRAIRHGEVDALVVSGAGGEHVFTLQSADRPYRVLVEQMQEGAAMLAADGTILYGNRRLAEMLGLPLQKVMGAPFHSLVAPADVPVFEGLLKQGRGASAQGEISLRTADGTVVPAFLSVGALPLGEMDAVCLVVTDLSEQKRNQEIIAAQRLARTVLDQVGEAILTCDPSGRIIRANRAAIDWAGQSPIGQAFEAAFPLRQWMGWPGESRETARAGGWQPFDLLAAIREGEAQKVEVRWPRSDGPRDCLLSAGPLVDAQGENLGCVVSLTDITERHRAEQALRESQARTGAILASAMDGIIAVDENLRILVFNPAAERILRCPASKAVGQTLERFIPERFRARHRGHVLQFARADAGSRAMGRLNEVWGLRADGDEFPMEASISHSQVDGDAFYAVILRDVTERKQAEAALRESQRDLNRAQAVANTGSWRMHVPRNELLWSDETYRIFGIPKGTPQTYETFLARVHPDDREFVDRSWQAALRGAPYDLEHRIVVGESLKWVRERAEMEFDAQGGLLGGFGTVQDITQRKRAEETLRLLAEAGSVLAASLDYESSLQSVARLAVASLADGCIVDVMEDDGSIRRVALASSDLAKEALGWEMKHPFSIRRDTHPVARVLATGEPALFPVVSEDLLRDIASCPEHLEMLKQIEMASVLIVPLVSRTRILGTLTLLTHGSGRRLGREDVATAEELARRAALAIENARHYLAEERARRRAELAAERTARLQAITAALSKALTPAQVAEVVVQQGLTVTGAVAGMVMLLSEDEAALEVLQSVGYSESMTAGLRRVPLDMSAGLTDSFRTRGPVWVASHSDYLSRYEHAADMRAAHGLEAFAAVPLEVDGEARGVLGLSFVEPRAFDPEDRDFIQTLARLCAQALERSRLYETERQAVRQRDQFLSVASHELRTPMTVLQGYTEGLARMVERGLESEPEGSASVRLERARLVRGLEKLGQASTRLSRLISELLDVSRIQHQGLALSLERVDLSALLANVLEAVAQKQETGRYAPIQVRVKSSVEGPVWGEWDAGRLEQVLVNLIDNALKYSPPTGEVTVSLDVEPDEANPSRARVHLVVHDQGIGIPPEEGNSIFQLYTRGTNASARNYPGMGLGLAISREIVERHGGRIWVESEGSGQGSAFHVVLPGAEMIGPGGRRGEEPG